MSLFDVIKYPISDPPTKEELAALPEDLYMSWLKLCGLELYHSPRSMTLFFSKQVRDNLPLLKELIVNYDHELAPIRKLIGDDDEPF